MSEDVMGETEVLRELRRYIVAVRSGLLVTIVALVTFPFVIRFTVGASGTFSWPMAVDVGIWLAGLVVAFWGRSRMYALRREWAAGASGRETPS